MKYLEIREGFSINKDEIEGIENSSASKLNFNGLSSNITMKSGRIYNTNISYKSLIALLEVNDSAPINKFQQHNVG